ncbi:PIG-L family deacetylase [Candidatus Uhrbacteria bacterium]|nr:PIG-L family deacetylase [Candidatus Uhrbacteria bacterium]
MKFWHKLTARWDPRRAAYKFVMKDWLALSDLGALSRVLESKRFSQNLGPVVMECPQGKRILVLAPHPDDDVFGAGGVLIRSIAAGAKVKTVCITGGEQAGEDETAAVREKETRQAAEVLKNEVEFWQYPARTWRVEEKIKDRLRAIVAQWKPDTIFLPFLADDHEDHRRTSELWYQTFKDASLSCEVWAYQVYSTVLPNVVVDVTEVMEDKLRLVRMHKSQMQKRDWVHYIKGLNAFNVRWLKTREPRYAETFFVVPAKDYVELCRIYYEG